VRRREAGQAAVELVAVAPLIALAALVAAQLVLAARAELVAQRALDRGLAAAAAGGDPAAAARAGLVAGARVHLRGRELQVAVPLPELDGLLGTFPPARASALLQRGAEP
jgi:hypothetical protein